MLTNGRKWEANAAVSMAASVKEIGHRQVYDILQGRKPRATSAGRWGKRFSRGWPGTEMTTAIDPDAPRCDNREELQA
jgi:hypothetical protein